MAVNQLKFEITKQVKFGQNSHADRKSPKTLCKPECMSKHQLPKLFIIKLSTSLVFHVSPNAQQIQSYSGKGIGLFTKN